MTRRSLTTWNCIIVLIPHAHILRAPPGDEEPPDSSSQVAWLRSLGDREALFQVMDGDRRSIQSLEAAEALAQLGDVRGLDHLIATLNNPASGLRMEAAEILQHLEHPRGMRALRESGSGDTVLGAARRSGRQCTRT